MTLPILITPSTVAQEPYVKKYKKLRFTVLTPEYDPIRVRCGDLLHEWGKKIGIEITNKPVDFSTLCDYVWDKLEFDMYIIGWGMSIMPWYYDQRYASWEWYPGGNNAEGFQNATFDALLNESLKTIDLEKRRELILKMQEILAEEVPIVGLYMRDMVEAVRAETSGWVTGVWGIDWFRSVLQVTIGGKEGGDLYVPLMDDMRKESIVDFGGTTWDAYPLDLIFERLFIFDEKYEPIPWLCKSYTVSEDGLVWTLELVDNVTWHDGKPFTAEDVKFTIEYIKENKAPWWYASVAPIEKVEVVDTYRVRIYLKEVYVWFLRKMADLPIVPKHLWENIPWNTTNPPMIGTGPFTWVQRVPGEYVELKKNPNYWKAGCPKVDRIIFPIITNPSAMLLALKKGEIHYMTWYVPPAAISEVARDPNLKLYSTPSPSFYYLGFNMKVYPLSEKVVRKAIAMIIDKEKIVNELLMGWARPANWYCAPTYEYWWNPNATTPEYNPELAARMLDEAGFIDIDGDGIREVPLEFKPGLSVTTSKPTYNPGETLIINGKLTTEKMEPIAGENVTVTVYDPLNREFIEQIVTTDESGEFKITHMLVEGVPLGTYTVKVKALGEESTTTFKVELPPPPPPSFWEQYSGYVIGGIGILIAIIAITWATMIRRRT